MQRFSASARGSLADWAWDRGGALSGDFARFMAAHPLAVSAVLLAIFLLGSAHGAGLAS